MSDGGPAFPQPLDPSGEIKRITDGNVSSLMAGMTLRDYFAAKAMEAGIIQAPPSARYPSLSDLAEAAYMIADAMLAEREKK